MNRFHIIPVSLLGLLFLMASLPALAQDDKIQNTIDSLNLAIHKRPADPFPVHHKATLFLLADSQEEAFRFFKQVALMFSQNPDSSYRDIAADSYYHLADLTYRSARPKKEAYNYALAALKLKPTEKQYRVMSARVLVAIPETVNDGQSQYEDLVKDYPDDAEVLLEYATYLEAVSPDRASAIYEKILRNNPSDAKSLYALGNYEVNKGLKQTDPKKSIKHYLKAEGYLVAALQKEPTNDIYRKKLGDLYSSLMWYYKRQKDKESVEKTKLYQKKVEDLGLKE